MDVLLRIESGQRLSRFDAPRIERNPQMFSNDPSAMAQTDRSGARLTAARISVAGLAQTRGLARRLCSAM